VSRLIWFADTLCSLNGSRLKAFLSPAAGDGTTRLEHSGAIGAVDGLHHFTAPTLPHLFALLIHPSDSFPPPKTSLLVIDNISALFSLAFPRSNGKSDDKQTLAKKNRVTQWASGRRWAMMDKVISDLGKMAVTKNMAIVLINQVTTRIRDEAQAMLYPAIAGNAWDGGIATRIVLYRDWLAKALGTPIQSVDRSRLRFAGIVKAKNVTYKATGKLTTFRINDNGLEEESIDAAVMNTCTPAIPPSTSLKRRHGEIADSDSENGETASDHGFGWDDEATLEAGVLEE